MEGIALMKSAPEIWAERVRADYLAAGFTPTWVEHHVQRTLVACGCGDKEALVASAAALTEGDRRVGAGWVGRPLSVVADDSAERRSRLDKIVPGKRATPAKPKPRPTEAQLREQSLDEFLDQVTR